jgi:uncharacterized protein (UPF0212 family)
MKKAKLVYISLATRIIVDENATDEEIMKQAIPKFIDKLNDDGILDNVEDIVDDEECPYGEFEGENK